MPRVASCRGAPRTDPGRLCLWGCVPGCAGAASLWVDRSQVEHDLVEWLRAADQRASVGRGFDGVGIVPDIAGDERRLAGMAHTGPAGPADWHVACLGELQDAGVVAAPADGQVAAGELDGRAGPRLTGGWVGRPCRCRGDTGRQARRGTERFG